MNARVVLAAAAAVTVACAGLVSANAVRPPSAPPAAGAAALAPSALAVTTQLNPGWALSRLDERLLPVDARYRYSATGAGVTAYVIDGGLEATHAQFGGRASIGVDLIGGPSRGCSDEIGIDHGTFVAGIVGGATTGVAKGVRIVGVRALKCGEGTEPLPMSTQRAKVLQAVNWVRNTARRPAVVNMSLNFDSPFPDLDEAIRRLALQGILTVVSAGNDDSDDACDHPPASSSATFVVAASMPNDRHWSGSNGGRCVDAYAPGYSIKSVAAGGGTYYYAGVGATSWAAPFVTGAAALYLSRHPSATPAQVRAWLVANATTGRISGRPSGTPNRLLYSFGAL